MKTFRYYLSITLFVLFSVLVAAPNICLAQDDEGENPFDKMNIVKGPAVADMDQWAQIKVPAGYVFANGDDTRILMDAMGNPPTDREVGFLAPENLDWFVVFEFDDVGYVKDDEKDSLDADAMLDSIAKGTEESNKIRRKKGFPGLNIVGWEVKPQYNEVTHNFEWAIRFQEEGGGLVLNHNTRLLGRRGVMEVTLVVDPQLFAEVLPVYRANLDEFSFKKGQAYAEFIQGDKVAQFGLTALVVGGAGAAAAKFGLFKLIGKFGKVIFLAVLAFFAGIWRKIKSIFAGGSGKEVKTISEETRFTTESKDTGIATEAAEARFASDSAVGEWECHCGAINDADVSTCKECFEEGP